MSAPAERPDPVGLAEEAAVVLRRLWEATEGRDGYACPADVDCVLADLGDAARHFGRALAAASASIEHTAESGQLRDDRIGVDPVETAATLSSWLASARNETRYLVESLRWARRASCHLSETTDAPAGAR